MARANSFNWLDPGIRVRRKGDGYSLDMVSPVEEARDPYASDYYTRNQGQLGWFGSDGVNAWNLLTGNIPLYEEEDAALLRRMKHGLAQVAENNPEAQAYIDSLSDDELLALGRDYETYVDYADDTYYGLTGAKKQFDYDALSKDLEQLVNYDWAEEPVYSNFYDKALSEVDTEFAPIFERYAEQERMLDALRATRQSEYAEDLNSIRQEYGTARQGILSQQAAQNARLSDTMTSQMERSRRNALEAGASAGIRLAGNVNAMLSSQNQMAQTSLDTSNQLAQMLLNQRNAERGARTAYNSYMDQDMRDRAALDANRSDLELSRVDRATGRAQSQYAQAQDDYANRQAYQDNYFANNSLTDSYERYRTGGKYSK